MARPRVSTPQPSLIFSNTVCIRKVHNWKSKSNFEPFFPSNFNWHRLIYSVLLWFSLHWQSSFAICSLGVVLCCEWSKIITRHILIQIKADELVATFLCFLACVPSCFLNCDGSKQLLSPTFAALNWKLLQHPKIIKGSRCWSRSRRSWSRSRRSSVGWCAAFWAVIRSTSVSTFLCSVSL